VGARALPAGNPSISQEIMIKPPFNSPRRKKYCQAQVPAPAPAGLEVVLLSFLYQPAGIVPNVTLNVNQSIPVVFT
jgi:hypothetical protein